jgi:hypothetical protein
MDRVIGDSDQQRHCRCKLRYTTSWGSSLPVTEIYIFSPTEFGNKPYSQVFHYQKFKNVIVWKLEIMDPGTVLS